MLQGIMMEIHVFVMCLSLDVSLSESRHIQSMADGKRIRCKASGLDESNVVISSMYV